MQHSRLRPSRLGLVLLAPLALPLAAATNVHVVAPTAGPGVDFTDIQAAVHAASSGDILLVKTGTYPPFSIFGKSLTVLEDSEQHAQVSGQITVEDLPASSAVVLRGLSTSTPSGYGLLARHCAGALRVEECEFEGEQVPNQYETAVLFHGAQIEACADVALVRSKLTGGNGNNVGFFGQPFSGATGLVAEDSVLTIVDCELRGGWGASSPEDDTYSGANGGHGVWVNNSTLWLSGSTAWGGSGGSGDEDFDFLLGWICGDGGAGGSGLVVASWDDDTWSYLASQVTVRDFEAWPGPGGGVLCGVPGDNGVDVLVGPVAPHLVELLNGSGRGFYTNSPVHGGETLRVYAEGQPGDFFFLALGGPHFAPLDFPGSPLPLALGPPYVVIPLGTVGATGQLVSPFPLGPLPSGFGGATLPLQGALLNADQGFALELAAYGTTTLLE